MPHVGRSSNSVPAKVAAEARDAAAHWREHLEGLPVLTMPTGGVEPGAPATEWRQLRVKLSAARGRRLVRASREAGVRPVGLLAAAVWTLLSRYGGQDDAAVLVSTGDGVVPLRCAATGDETFGALLGRVGDGMDAAKGREFDSLAAMVDGWEGDPPSIPAVAAEGEVAPDAAPAGTALVASVRPAGQGLAVSLSHRPGRIGADAAQRIAGHLGVLLATVAADLDRPLSTLPPVADEERERLLFAFNENATAVPLAGIADLFEEQVRRDPDAPAVRYEGIVLTYAELNGRANQLASALAARGVGATDIVAVALPRSVEAVVAMLAIVKSGAAFLPLDVTNPADRIAFVLGDAAPALVLTTVDGAGVLPAGVAAVALDDEVVRANLARLPEGDVPGPRPLDAPAYVIYTSGSTGRPKGVVVSHGGIASLVRTHEERLEAGPGSRVLQFAPLSFDASVWELCMALLTGGTLVVAPTDRLQPGAPLVELAAEHEVTHLTLPPSALAVVPAGGLASVRVLVVAGEACPPDLATRWSAGRRMVNAYGPTETTVCATMSPPLAADGHAPIGAPVVNTRVYVLDAAGQPVPAGVVGELYVAGSGVAKGYLNRPDLTEERFVPDTVRPQDGGRMYRTGDLVRSRDDGQLEFVGRADDQVKVRGFRIELGEIEVALAEHPAVAHAVVIARGDSITERQLVAYVVPAGGARLDVAEVRAFLGRRLPEYMVPPLFVSLDRMPLTPNGKVDRRALPAPAEAVDSGAEFVAPATPLEHALAAIWADVLNLPEVGVRDNFFQLGGDSLRSIQVLARAREELGVELFPRLMFDRPTVAELAAYVESLGGPVESDTIRPVPREPHMPLSFAQQRLWFLNEFEPDSTEYNLSAGLRVTGRLDLAALGRALTRLTERHEVLRTRLVSVDGRGVQVIGAVEPVGVPVVDLTAAPDLDAELDRRVRAEMVQPFDLGDGPLLRPVAYRLAAEEHLLVLSLHHVVIDRWGTGVLIREMTALYDEEVAGVPARLPAMPVQYADFAAWQQARAGDEAVAADIEYWRERLAGLAPLELPTDRPRPATRTWPGDSVRMELPVELGHRLRRMCRKRGATLFMALTAAVQVVLSRWSGSTDVAVATATAGRDHAELENVLGFFVNTLVLRSQVEPELSFVDLVDSVKDTVLEAFAHQQAPFERVVDVVAPDRDPSRTPLAQAMVVYHDALVPEVDSRSGLRITERELPRLTTMFDLTVELVQHGEELVAQLGYNTDLFDRATIERMAGHLQVLLEGVVADPRRPLSAVPMLTAAEREQLASWNDTAVPYPSDRCVHELFAERAQAGPDRVALVEGDIRLTYGQLDAHANRLAGYLRELGVERGTPVGVCLPRCWQMVAALLGVLKAGGAYVPLDPEYPADRLAFMLADSGAPVVVTRQALAHLAEGHTGAVVCLDTDWEAIGKLPPTAPETGVTAEDLAYIMYTSGSTGLPKGVASPHRATVRTFVNGGFIDCGPDEVIPQTLSISWDGLSAELWSVLLHGGTSVLYPGRRPDPEVLADMVAEHGVTTLCMPPSLLNAFVDEYPHVLRKVRQVATGGDVASPAHIAAARKAAPDLRIVNGYGPVETTVVATYYEVPADFDDSRPVPIGRPLANTRVYVVDGGLSLVPVGVAGELLVGGDGLARGYWGREALTAERFVELPWLPGERVYRTGDVVRWLPDGVLEFMGRVDEQVKVRGFRVELGEVEGALLRAPGVAEAAVVAFGDGARRRLAGFVVPVAGVELDVADVRGFVGGVLPDYMVPAVVVVLDRLPLTPSGKVDRRALPAPDVSLVRGGAEFVAPRSEVERVLVSVWQDVLGVDRIGVHDNFFELGGDSILSIQLVSRARAEGLWLTSKDLFVRQTIAGLGQGLSFVDGGPVGSGPVVGDVALTPIQHRFLAAHPTHPEHFSQSVELHFNANPDEAALRAALAALVEHHDALRTRFERDGEGWRQHIVAAEDGELLRVHDLSRLGATDQEQTIADIAAVLRGGWRLETGPLCRAALVRLGSGQPARLLLAAHHLVVDGVSWRILLDDLATAYGQASRGEGPSLPRRTSSFQAWAGRLAAHTAGGGLDAEAAYWTAVGGAPATPVPTDAHGPNTAGSVRTVTARLDRDSTEALLREAPAAYRTRVNDVLLAALGRTLAGWLGGGPVRIALEGHGRADLFDDLDLTRTVGWFTSVYPFDLTLPATAGWAELIRMVKERLRAVPNEGLGYDALRHLAPTGAAAAALAGVAQPQISFNYLGQWQAAAGGEAFTHRGGIPLDQHDAHERPHLLDVVASVEDGELSVIWVYSSNVHRQETVQRLADGMTGALREVVAHCRTAGAVGYTPSDFPYAGLDQAAVDRVVGDGRGVEDVYRLTPMQAGMLFHSLTGDGSGAYLGQVAFTLDGVRDPRALGAAWQVVVDRTPVLRSSMVWEGVPEPVQVVHRRVVVPVEYLDWSGLPEGERRAAAAAYQAADRARGTDLRTAPLARLAIARLSESSVQVFCTMHHLLLDGWSTFEVLSEVFAV
ncbi:amino acid adenylation domain-containing protein, partial [Phytohabitans kaempferiae]